MRRLLRRLQKLIVDSFGFSKTETNGFLTLILVVFLFAIVPRIYLNNLSSENSSDLEDFSEWTREIESSIQIKKDESHELIKPSDFNPNQDSFDGLISAGLPELQTKRLIAYRNKGGLFRKKEDLKKIYGLTDSMYYVLEPHIIITLKSESPVSEMKKDSIKMTTIPLVRFELNEATPDQLRVISGIGPVLSERIVKYRDLLGGFHNYKQLSEVYGLKPEVIIEITEKTKLKSGIEPVMINAYDTIGNLAKHPYIDYKLARAILNYRKVHGDFMDISELKNIKILDDSLYHRLAPYLSL